MNNIELIQLIREEFIGALQGKPSWGKNEVAFVFERAMVTAAAKILDRKEEESRGTEN